MKTHDRDHAWHVAINGYHYPADGGPPTDGRSPWMYEAKTLAQEVPRLEYLFGAARRGELPAVHRQCSRSAPEALPCPNTLRCCLGVDCAACPQLLALDRIEGGTPEDIDRAKAWTCAAHIVSQGGDVAREGYILTTDDRMFWDRMYASMASGQDEQEEE
jgi:hypothetical protein